VHVHVVHVNLLRPYSATFVSGSYGLSTLPRLHEMAGPFMYSFKKYTPKRISHTRSSLSVGIYIQNSSSARDRPTTYDKYRQTVLNKKAQLTQRERATAVHV